LKKKLNTRAKSVSYNKSRRFNYSNGSSDAKK